MGNILVYCFERTEPPYYDDEVSLIYAPYCNMCRARIFKQVTLREGKYYHFFCTDECKHRYIKGRQCNNHQAT